MCFYRARGARSNLRLSVIFKHKRTTNCTAAGSTKYTQARFQFVWHIRTNLQVACVTDPIISGQLETFRLAFQFVDFKHVPNLRKF